ncbi:MAG: pitrilysin family protein, partial [bacterium]
METKVTREIIRGGTVVLTEELPHLLTASVGFWINFGSRAEEEAQYGASHFIEHMLFKGTERMGPRDLALAIESVGGSIGAAASEEKTYCNARVLPEHLPIAVSIISDMFGRSQFPDAEFAREKEVVLEEIKAHEDTPEDLIYDLFLEDIYGREGLGHNPLGYEDTIKAMTRDDLFALYRRYYRPAHLIVSVAGNLGGMNIPELVARELEPCVEPACNILGHKASISDFTPKIKLRKKDTGQVQFCLGAPGVPFDSPDRFIYMALDVILSGGMSSRLFQEVRE